MKDELKSFADVLNDPDGRALIRTVSALLNMAAEIASANTEESVAATAEAAVKSKRTVYQQLAYNAVRCADALLDELEKK